MNACGEPAYWHPLTRWAFDAWQHGWLSDIGFVYYATIAWSANLPWAECLVGK